MAASTASGSLWPPRLNSLMPLSGIGLWLAEIITPRSASARPVRKASAGVGSTPTRSTSAPADVSPATTAASSISPLARGSRPTTATGRCVASFAIKTRAAAPATWSASSGVRSAFARPLTPSVPKSDPTRGLALRVLGRLAGLLEPVLLSLLGPRVASEEAGLLQRRPILGLEPDQRPGDGQAEGAGLPCDATSGQRRNDVVLVGLLQCDERLLDELLMHLVRKVAVEGAAVELELTRTGHQTDADHGFLAAADNGCGGHFTTSTFWPAKRECALSPAVTGVTGLPA